MNSLAKSFCALILAATLPLSLAAAPAGVAGRAGRAGAGRGAGAGAAGPQAALALSRAFYTTEFDTLSQTLTLTDDQKPKLQSSIDTMNKEIDIFLQNAPAQIAAGRGRGGRGAAAGRAGRGAAATALGTPNAVALKLQDDLQQLINEHQVLINKDLTPEQCLKWETYKLNRLLDQRLLALSLTDDQRDKVKALSDDTAKTLAALADGKTIASLQGQLFRKIVADVLTDSQISRLFQGAMPVQGRGAQGAAGAVAPGAGL